MNGPVPGTPSDFYARNLPTEQSRESREKLWSRGMPDRLDGGIQAMHRWGLAGGQLTGCFGPLYVALYIPGVQPGARLLLHAEGENQVRAVLERIDTIEALSIAPSAASPAYWRTLANRLAAHLALPEYSAERHAAWLAGRALP